MRNFVKIFTSGKQTEDFVNRNNAASGEFSLVDVRVSATYAPYDGVKERYVVLYSAKEPLE